MARNEEKNFTILNRLYLQNQAEASKDKNPERPHLNTLSTGAQVKKWIPGIKWEINFCLHHLSGIRNYPDYKIREFQERLEQLKGEYKRWVKRALELDPDTPGIPGDPHVYVSKRTMDDIKQRKAVAQHLNPNGYTKLYTRSINMFRVPKADEPEVEYDEQGFAKEEEIEDYFAEAGGIDGLDAGPGLSRAGPGTDVAALTTPALPYAYFIPPSMPQQESDEFETPLAVRPDGYVSDEDKQKEKINKAAIEEDIQNKPLSFAPKKRAIEPYQYNNKKQKSEPEKPVGLGLGLVDYGSDDE